MGIDITKHIAALVETYDGASLYWKDTEGVYWGCNNFAAMKAKLNDPRDIIGRTDYDLFSAAEAEAYRKNDLEVFQGKTFVAEESFTLPDGTEKFHLSTKRPLYSNTKPGVIIGQIGHTIDITERKEAERLRSENEKQKDFFATLARKVSHDIQSPLTILRILTMKSPDIPESVRATLIKATDSVVDIANKLILDYKLSPTETILNSESRDDLLVADYLIELANEKKVQHENKSVTIEVAIDDRAKSSQIRMQRIEFKRSLSNLANNAVDALLGKGDGKIIFRLTTDDNFVFITIQDNGKGMSDHIKQKILKRQGVTDGKPHGHGIGLQQVWDTLDHNQGFMSIESAEGIGTNIKLTFPRIETLKT